MALKGIASHKNEDTLASKTAEAVPTVQKIEDGLGLASALAVDQRRQLNGIIRGAPDDAIARVIALGLRHGGSIAGIPFDAEAAQSALADADGAFALSATLRTLASRLDDEGRRAKAGVAEQVTAIVMGLRGLVRTEQGKALGQELAEIDRVKRAHARKKRSRAPSANEPKGGAEVKPPPPPPASPPGKVSSVNAVLNVPLGKPTVTTEEDAA